MFGMTDVDRTITNLLLLMSVVTGQRGRGESVERSIIARSKSLILLVTILWKNLNSWQIWPWRMFVRLKEVTSDSLLELVPKTLATLCMFLHFVCKEAAVWKQQNQSFVT